MEIQKIQKKDNRDVVITVRVTKEDSEWMKEKNISPTLLFNEAVKELKEKFK